jgi:thymidine kinase
MQNMAECGELTVIIGPMFASKSTRLVALLNRSAVVERRCTYVMPKKGARDFLTHCKKIGLHDAVTTRSVASLAEIELVKGDVVGIDEGQFFADLPEYVIGFISQGCTVFVASLDADYRGKPFGRVHELQSYAISYTKLNAVCKRCVKECGRELPANRTWKHNKISNAADGIEDIGGSDKYEAVCNYHYNKLSIP